MRVGGCSPPSPGGTSLSTGGSPKPCLTPPEAATARGAPMERGGGPAQAACLPPGAPGKAADRP